MEAYLCDRLSSTEAQVAFSIMQPFTSKNPAMYAHDMTNCAAPSHAASTLWDKAKTAQKLWRLDGAAWIENRALQRAQKTDHTLAECFKSRERCILHRVAYSQLSAAKCVGGYAHAHTRLHQKSRPGRRYANHQDLEPVEVASATARGESHKTSQSSLPLVIL